MQSFTWNLATAIAGTEELQDLLEQGYEPISVIQVIIGQNTITRETQTGLLVALKKMSDINNEKLV